jgi:hypothetical protein
VWVQFDKVMACIEDVDGGEPQGFKEECDRDFLLTVRPGGWRLLCAALGWAAVRVMCALVAGVRGDWAGAPAFTSPLMASGQTHSVQLPAQSQLPGLPLCSCGPTSAAPSPTC